MAFHPTWHIHPADSSLKPTFSLLTRTQVSSLLRFYDIPHPTRPGHILTGYDKPHALRTTRMCVAVAEHLGHPISRLRPFETACLLHDMGRVGLRPKLFGQIWSWAKEQGIPTRPREWRACHPDTRYGKESEAFIRLYKQSLVKQGLTLNQEVRDHIDMRLGFAKRLRRQLPLLKSRVRELDLPWMPWMGQIMLYYYYPEKLERVRPWVRQLAEILVGCEQLEAYSNQRRGKDYYARSEESFPAAFEYLRTLTRNGILSAPVLEAIVRLAREGHFMDILRQARGGRLTNADQRFLRTLTA
ncbi:MAG: hypothetical protein AB7P17_04140 [Nitrospirales bacterium]